MGWNVPDDWGSYYNNCSYCGKRYHESEGGCYCLDDHEQCHGCANGYRGHNHYYGESRYEAEGYHHIDALVEIDGKYWCSDCQLCECCDTERDETKLEWSEDADMLLCPLCAEEDHYCPKDGPLLDHIAKVVEAD